MTDLELGPGPRRRRRGALRGLPALPVPRDVEQESVALAVRRFGSTRRGGRGPGRGRHPRGAVSGRRGPGAHPGGAVPAVAAPPGRTRVRRRRVRTGRRADHPGRVVADLGRSGRMRNVLRPYRIRRSAVHAAGGGRRGNRHRARRRRSPGPRTAGGAWRTDGRQRAGRRPAPGLGTGQQRRRRRESTRTIQRSRGP